MVTPVDPPSSRSGHYSASGAPFGERLRQYRKNRGVSQGDFAFYSGYSQNYVSRVERGDRNVSREFVEKAVRVLGLGPFEANKLRETAGFAVQAITFASLPLGRLDALYRSGTDADRSVIDFFSDMLADRLERSRKD